MRIARVLDASDPRVQSKPINGARRNRRTPLNPDRRRLSPDNELLLRVNEDEGPLTSIDRATLRSLGETPWDERPGFDGQSYAERHGVSHEELNAPDDERYVSEEELVAVDRARDTSVIDRLRRQHEDRAPMFPGPSISEPQENLIERLLEQMSREVPDVFDVANNWYRDMHASGKMTRVKATEMIGRLKHHLGYEEKGWNRRPDWKPAREAIVPTAVDHSTPIDYFDDIPDAYYALRNDEGTVKFYRVSTFKRCLPGQTRPNRKVQLQSSDELHPARAEAARRILREIREMKPREAAFLYGREIGRCCRCGRTLTDEVSRSMGIGPDCAAKSW